MAYIEGEQRRQHTLFPTTLDELISEDHVCRVIEAFVGRLDMAKLGFVRSKPAETGPKHCCPVKSRRESVGWHFRRNWVLVDGLKGA